MTTDKAGPATQAMMTSLYWLYDRIVSRKDAKAGTDALPGSEPGSEKQIAAMIRRAAAQAGTVGFATNMGGLLTLPLALPVNMAGVSSLQINLIQDIARARGYDLGSEQVRTLTIACLAGTAVVDILKDVGVSVGMRLSRQAILGLSGAVLGRINKAVAGRLVTAAGASGAVTLARVVPFVGGAISGTVDGLATAAVGAAAKRVFVRQAEPSVADEPAPLALPAPAAT
jgi:hypothetical protein